MPSLEKELIKKWLRRNDDDVTEYDGLEVYYFDESIRPNEEIIRMLNDLILNTRYPCGFLENLARQYGTEQVNKDVVKKGLPKYDSLRKGFFGESVIGDTLIHFLDYVIPVQKNQYAILANRSLPRTDIIALQLEDERISEVCYVEVKLRTTKDASSGVVGYSQLKKDYPTQIPELLTWILARLYEQGDPLFYPFREYIFDRKNAEDLEKLLVGLVYESTSWTETALKNLSTEVIKTEKSDVMVTVIRILELGKLTKEIFDNVGVLEVINDE